MQTPDTRQTVTSGQFQGQRCPTKVKKLSPPFFVTPEAKARWKQIIKEEMILYIRRTFPDLQSATYFIPHILFNTTQYMKPKGGNAAMADVVFQKESQLSSLSCNNNDSIVRRCLSHLSQTSTLWVHPYIVVSNYPFDNYLLKELTVPTELQGSVSVKSGNRTAETSESDQAELGSPSSACQQTSGFSVSKARDLFPSPSDLDPSRKRGDFDCLIVSRQHGFIVVEIKNIGDQTSEALSELPGHAQNKMGSYCDKLSKSIFQLDKAEIVLRQMLSDIAEEAKITKVLAVPNFSRHRLKFVLESNPDINKMFLQCFAAQSVEEATAKCLCADDVMSGSSKTGAQQNTETSGSENLAPLIKWWEHVTSALHKEARHRNETKDDPASLGQDKLSSEQYEEIISRFCGPYSKVVAECRKGVKDEVRTVADCIHLTGIRFGQSILREDQLQILASDDRFVYLTGPPGSGKTLLLGLKAAEWAFAGNHVVFLSISGMCWGTLVSMVLYERVTEKLRGKDKLRAGKCSDICKHSVRDRSAEQSCVNGSAGSDSLDVPSANACATNRNAKQTSFSKLTTSAGDQAAFRACETDVSRPTKQEADSQPQNEEFPAVKRRRSANVNQEENAPENVHFKQLSINTNARELVRALVDECLRENTGLRLIVDDMAFSKTPEELCKSLNSILSLLREACCLLQGDTRPIGCTTDSATGELSQMPATQDLRRMCTRQVNEERYMTKVTDHLHVMRTTLGALRPTHDYQPATLASPAWRDTHATAVACWEEIDGHVRRMAEARAGRAHVESRDVSAGRVLEKLEAILLAASGLLFNVLTWLRSHALMDVFTVLANDYPDTDVKLWSSGVIPHRKHDSFVVKRLTQCVRCPPEIQRVLELVQKDVSVSPGYTFHSDAVVVSPPLPLPCQGSQVKILDHRDHMTEVKEITDCAACGENLAAYFLRDLKVGDQQCLLRFEDILIIGTLDIANGNCQMLQAVASGGVPLVDEGSSLARPPPFPGKACAIGGCAAQGLEAKIIVFIPDVCRIPVAKDDGTLDELQFPPDLPAWLRSMGQWNRSHLWFVASRALSHLIVFRV